MLIDVELLTVTLVALPTTLLANGTPLVSAMKLTEEPVVNPVPVMLIAVPPVIGPDVALIAVTVGTVGFQVQLFTAMLEPQYCTQAAEVGGATPPVG